MESYEIGFSDEFTYDGSVIKYEVTEKGKLQLYVEDCARALGVVKVSTLTDKTESITVRWDRVYDDLVGIEKIPSLGNFGEMGKEEKKEVRDSLKSMTISETELYLWSFRVASDQGKLFRDWLARVVLPNLREHGIYITGMEDMTPEEVKQVADERVERYILRKYGVSIRRSLTDAIKQVLNPAPYEGYVYGIYTNLLYNVLFGMDCKEYKDQLGLEKKDSLRDSIRDSDDFTTLTDIAKAEEFMGNLILSGVTDHSMLKSMMDNWHCSFMAMN